MDYRLGYEIEFLGEQSRDNIRAELHDLMNLDFYSLEENRKRYKKWHVKNDRSISREGYGDDFLWPQEIVSPVMDFDEGIGILLNLFHWLDEKGYQTNSSTALHINVSMADKNKIRSLEKFRLIMLLDEIGLLNDWNRTNNSYCRPHKIAILTQSILKRYPIRDLMLRDWESLVDNSKYRTINFSKLSSDYLEFRIIGGLNYHRKTGYIFDTIKQFMEAFNHSIAGSNEEMFRSHLAAWLEQYGDTIMPLPMYEDPATANRYSPSSTYSMYSRYKEYQGKQSSATTYPNEVRNNYASYWPKSTEIEKDKSVTLNLQPSESTQKDLELAKWYAKVSNKSVKIVTDKYEMPKTEQTPTLSDGVAWIKIEPKQNDPIQSSDNLLDS